MKTLKLILLTILPCTLGAAVQVQNNAFPNADLFGLRFTEAGGEFIGKASLIGSVALQKYVTTAFEITEMNIDIAGSNVQLRIYYTEPLKSSTVLPGTRNAINNPLDRINPAYTGKLQKLVYKDYPVTTHAKTLEFKVANKADLVDLHAQVRNRWIGAVKPGLNRTLFTVP
ncbi:MAG: hypothetical protein OSA95_00755 [Opitutales bacterium]|jgi:hypothetical protein|nr:hypothetical protein [Opitutales bacterium]